MFNKKNLLWAGLFVISFAAINAGMYFFLQSTQPKMGARVEMAGTKASADSTKAVAAKTPSPEPSAKADSSKAVNVAEVGLASNVASLSNQGKVEGKAEVKPAVAGLGEMPEATKMPSAAAPTTPVEPAPAMADTGTVADSASADKEVREMTKLAKLLESMKPDEAASIAGRLETDQIVVLVMKMKDRTAGKMLAAMPVEQAAEVALRMSKAAQRRVKR